MKKKYQEALDYLKSGNLFGELSNDSLKGIEELVDKETPMKPRHISICTLPPQHKAVCSNCHGFNLERTFRFCPFCGQKIDWNVE